MTRRGFKGALGATVEMGIIFEVGQRRCISEWKYLDMGMSSYS
jgi:hypothetical protein